MHKTAQMYCGCEVQDAGMSLVMSWCDLHRDAEDTLVHRDWLLRHNKRLLESAKLLLVVAEGFVSVFGLDGLDVIEDAWPVMRTIENAKAALNETYDPEEEWQKQYT